MTPNELRDKLLLSYGIGHGYSLEELEEIYGVRVDHALDAVIAALPDTIAKEVAGMKHPESYDYIDKQRYSQYDIDSTYDEALNDVQMFLQQAKSNKLDEDVEAK